ncbi:MAG: hypothetical protein KDA21_14950, partial [Phycisphaerales bacterium]|nr:hypothetical protein [Phycisphaerales bacterium]
VRNEQYWGQAPAIRELRYVAIADPAARRVALENGEVDVITGNAALLDAVANNAAFNRRHRTLVWPNLRSGFSFIAWNCGERRGRTTPFVDARVRRAMTHLIDRERMARDFHGGRATVCTGPFSPHTPQSDPSIEPWPMDLSEAARLLDEAGWMDRNRDGWRENERGDPFTFEFTYPAGTTTGPAIAAYLTAQAARVGVHCESRMVEWAAYGQIQDGRDFDALIMQWVQPAPEVDPRQVWHSDSMRQQGDNFVQWSSPTADRLIDEGRRELDPEWRMAFWHALHRHLHEEQPYTFLLHTPTIVFINRRICNVHTYPCGLVIEEMYIPAPLQ